MFCNIIQWPFNAYADDWYILPSLMFGKQDKWALLRYVLKPCNPDFKEGIKSNRCRNLDNTEDNPASLFNMVIHRLLFLDHLEIR